MVADNWKEEQTSGRKLLSLLARPRGFEPPAYRSVVCRSVQLSYGRASPGQNKWWGDGLNPTPKLAQWSTVFQKSMDTCPTGSQMTNFKWNLRSKICHRKRSEDVVAYKVEAY